jgi:hypothetical protein
MNSSLLMSINYLGACTKCKPSKPTKFQWYRPNTMLIFTGRLMVLFIGVCTATVSHSSYVHEANSRGWQFIVSKANRNNANKVVKINGFSQLFLYQSVMREIMASSKNFDKRDRYILPPRA